MPKPVRKRRIGFFMGVDPGQNGGIAVVTADDKLEALTSMPEEQDLVRWFEEVGGYLQGRVTAVLEKQHSMPKQGVASTFKLGVNYGQLLMCLSFAAIPFIVVPPKVWQSGLHIPPRKKGESQAKWKRRLMSVALRKFPKVKVTLKTADALLMALYCKLTN